MNYQMNTFLEKWNGKRSKKKNNKSSYWSKPERYEKNSINYK